MRYIPHVPPCERPEPGFIAPTDATCALCGGDIWPGEETGFSEDGYFCHALCVEKENGYGAKFYGGYRFR